MQQIPFRQRLSCSIRDACEATGIRRTMLYEMIKAGAVATTKVGSRTLVLVPSLIELAEKSSGNTSACGSEQVDPVEQRLE